MTSRPRQAVRVDSECWLAGREHALHRTALLLTGDPRSAKDLMQDTPTRLYRAWDRIEQRDRIDAHALRVLVNEHDAVLAFVASLPPRQRGLIVLRYYEHLTERRPPPCSVSPAAP